MQTIVYVATSPSGKHYVGITSKSLKRRMSQHYSSAKKGSPYTIHKALRKYDQDMKWQILKTVECYDYAKELECGYIALFNSFKKGYNSTLGGDGQLGRTFKHTEEAKRKIKANHYWTGKKRPHSEETKKKISENNGMRGKILTKKDRDKLAYSSGSVLFKVYKNETFIGEWLNKSQCAKDLGISRRTIIRGLSDHKFLRKPKYTFKRSL